MTPPQDRGKSQAVGGYQISFCLCTAATYDVLPGLRSPSRVRYLATPEGVAVALFQTPQAQVRIGL